MKSVVNHKILLAAVVAGLVLALIPLPADAATGKWLDEITALVTDHQEMLKFEGRERAYDPYLEQLGIVQAAFNRGDTKGTYVEMNQLMDMLETNATGSGIPRWSAKKIFDFCGKVTPGKFHDAVRHSRELSKGGFDYWDDDVIDFGGGA